MYCTSYALGSVRIDQMSKDILSKDTSTLFDRDGKANPQAIVEQYTPFVKGIVAKVKKSVSNNIEFDDLMSYGMAGLLEAAQRFDPKNGANFMTFAYYRVRGAIYDGLRGMGWVSRTEYAKIRYEERATAFLENQANRSMSGYHGEFDSEGNIEKLATQVSRLVTIYVTSLEAMEHRQFEDDKALQSEEFIYDKQMKSYMKKAITQLSEEDREIIVNYYFKDMTLQEVGQKMGLSKSWISRRHAQAIERLNTILKELLRE
jgi:RNA polymerase sigma factor for flagellar operon FliA